MTYFWYAFMGLLVLSVIVTAILEKVMANRPKKPAKLEAPPPDFVAETPHTEPAETSAELEEVDDPTETVAEDETLAPIE
jgi:hypothetical protein